MKSIEASDFQDQCLSLLEELDAEGLVITKNGRPVARVLPFEGPNAHLIGSLRHRVTVKGDLFTTGLPWNANRLP